MLTSKNLIWSKGYLNNEYSKISTEKISDENVIISLIENTKGVIFIRNGSHVIKGDLKIFADNLHRLKKPCILITSDGDRPVPSSYSKIMCEKILNNSMIKKWYTQNYDKSIIHKKLDYYPIGFDLHTSKWFINNKVSDKINFMINCRLKNPTSRRISNKIFSDTHYSMSHPIRYFIYEKIKNIPIFQLSKQKESFVNITKQYNKYNFCLSPRGNGRDCHRTWELFLAGVIVITLTSSLDDMFINNNLPVVILKNLNELENITEEKLDEWYKLNINKTNINNIFPKLSYDYWIN